VSQGWRRTPLPSNWDQLRYDCFERDGWQCTEILASGARCQGDGTLECDHLGEPDDHRLEMLATKCGWHHRRKSSAQANAARKRVTQRFPTEKHPGIRG